MGEKEQVIIITGGSRGIGKEIALKLAKDGYRIAILYKGNVSAAEKVKNEIHENNGIVEIYKVSVENYEEVSDCFKHIEENLGQIYGLVNNAGITRDGFLMMMKKDDWNEVLETNLLGAINCAHAAVKYMLKNECGKIINMSSIGGVLGIAAQTNYAASKSALLGFTRALAAELISKKIYVYGIAPGYIKTEMLNTISTRLLEDYKRTIPMERFGDVSEISEVIKELFEDKFSYTTGQTFIIDGGLCLR